MSSRDWRPLAAIATTLIFWSSAFVAIRHLGHVFTPGALSLGRLVVGSIGLGVVLLRRGGPVPGRRDWVPLIAIGVLWYGVYNLTLNAGELRIDAGTASMLIQLSPVLIAVLATVFLRERPTVALGVGLLLAFGGVVVIAFSDSPGGGDLLGVLLCVTAAAVYSISLIVQKPLVGRLPAIEVTWFACTIGAVVCLPFVGQLAHGLVTASTGDVLWLVYLGLFPTAIAFTTYAYALTHMSASRLGVTTYVVPPLTIAMGWIFLGEVPPPLAYLGGALCLVGVAVARRRPRSRSAVSQEAGV